MQNNSGDLCLLIGIYSFILFFLCVYELRLSHLHWLKRVSPKCEADSVIIRDLFARPSSISFSIHTRTRFFFLFFGNINSFQYWLEWSVRTFIYWISTRVWSPSSRNSFFNYISRSVVNGQIGKRIVDL